MSVNPLDSPDRYALLRETIQKKALLRLFYSRAYRRFAELLVSAAPNGDVLELGSGGGFAKNVIPGLITSDFLPYAGVDRQLDARAMEIPNASLRGLLLIDVFHHIPDAERFLGEAQRCLAPGGCLFMVEPYPGWVGRPVYRYLHHEPYAPDAPTWQFESDSALGSANTALPQIVFQRDRKRFEALFPSLRLDAFRIHSPFQYWLSGGLRFPSLVPGWASRGVTWVDASLSKWLPRSGSFVDIEIVRT